MPSKPTIPSLASLADIPDVPSPVLALVGVGDAATQAARELQAKLAAVDTSTLDMRDHEVRIDLSALDLGRYDLSKFNPRNIDVAKFDPRNIDAASITATGLLWAARGQERYESLVARGEAVVTKARGTDWSEAVAEDAPIVAEPPAAKAPAAEPTTEKKTTAKSTPSKSTAAKTTKKATAPKADPEA